jgi:hypothetical protein
VCYFFACLRPVACVLFFEQDEDKQKNSTQATGRRQAKKKHTSYRTKTCKKIAHKLQDEDKQKNSTQDTGRRQAKQ